MELTRNNHYVPMWYQKRFLLPGEHEYYYMNLKPLIIQCERGEEEQHIELRRMTPRQCFRSRDLYTTTSGVPEDWVERMVFGNIDDMGAKGLRAFLKHDMHELHLYLKNFFGFMDAQRLRTPKGLD